MAEQGDTQKLFTQLQVLKNEVEQVSNFNSKLDNAIDKLTDISGSIKSMLAVHEEKLSKQEEIDKAIFNLLESRRVESDSKFEDIHGRLNKSVEGLREEVWLMLFEPNNILHTGEVKSKLTVENYKKI